MPFGRGLIFVVLSLIIARLSCITRGVEVNYENESLYIEEVHKIKLSIAKILVQYFKIATKLI